MFTTKDTGDQAVQATRIDKGFLNCDNQFILFENVEERLLIDGLQQKNIDNSDIVVFLLY